MDKLQQLLKHAAKFPALNLKIYMEMNQIDKMSVCEIAYATSWANKFRFSRKARASLLFVERAARRLGVNLVADLLGDAGISTIDEIINNKEAKEKAELTIKMAEATPEINLTDNDFYAALVKIL